MSWHEWPLRVRGRIKAWSIRTVLSILLERLACNSSASIRLLGVVLAVCGIRQVHMPHQPQVACTAWMSMCDLLQNTQCSLSILSPSVSLQDSTQVQNIDAVIYCTGYQYSYPFLEGTGLITSHDMRVDPLWQHIFPPSVAPILAFVGLAWKSIRNQQFELQVPCTFFQHVYTAQCNEAQHSAA